VTRVMHLVCLICGEESEISDDVHVHGCPKCGDTGVPADLDATTTIRITTQELRILTRWASDYARELDHKSALNGAAGKALNIVRTIVDRLATQTPVALTLEQEVADMRASHPNSKVTVHRSDGTEVDI
jgi:predicted  nucleic acid-binding Zn-ribbon protein